MQKNENNIIIYQDENGITKVNVRFVDEDIWLTQNQIAEMMGISRSYVSRIETKAIHKLSQEIKDEY